VSSRAVAYSGRVRIIVAGGAGFLGRPLVAALTRQGHDPVVLTRRSDDLPKGYVHWNPDGSTGDWASVLDGSDAVVNLAGASIAGRRWTPRRKRDLLQSRVLATRSLVEAMRHTASRPRIFVSASGVGYYGPRGGEEIGEDEPASTDFLGQLATQWEAEARAATELGVRLAILRNGLVLAADGGILKRMAMPFRLGLGGPIGAGTQYMPWIHRRDWIDLVRWMLITDAAHGAFNATSPQPVTNEEFSRALARAVRRPCLFRVPGRVMRVVFGELGESLLTGQRAVPRKALAMGFHFRWPQLDAALREALS